MKKRILALTVAITMAAGIAVTPSVAQQWPQRPVTFVVPFAAGGGTDAFARPLAAQLDQQLGQRVIIDNKAGAGGTLGASFASKAAPDGYTFFVGAAHHTIAPSLYPKLDYDIEKDFIPIAIISIPPQTISVHPGRVPAKTLAELIAYAKANPDKLNFASAGVGTTHHLAGELFKTLTGTKINHISYRGAGPAMADLVAGHVDMMFDGLGSSASQITSGAIRGLAVAAPTRSSAIPDVPTAKEAGLAGFEVATWYALWAPKNTPQPILDRMTQEVVKALKTDAIKAAWEKNGSPIPDMTGAKMGAFVSTEIGRWSKVVKEANIKIE